MFKNKTVLISGGLGDIGFAAARAFAKEGASVAISDIHPEKRAKPYLDELAAIGVKSHYKKVDVTDPNQIQAWLNEVEVVLGIPQMIVVGAAIVHFSNIHDLTPEQWKKELDVNLNGAFYLVQCTTKLLMRDKLNGRVVFIGSWAGSHVHSNIPAYSVSKAALEMLRKCFALELASKNILVNEVTPGYVDAGLSGRNWEKYPEKREKAREKIPTKQLITADEVASQIIYLCNPNNKHLTGSSILMDGGLSLR